MMTLQKQNDEYLHPTPIYGRRVWARQGKERNEKEIKSLYAVSGRNHRQAKVGVRCIAYQNKDGLRAVASR